MSQVVKRQKHGVEPELSTNSGILTPSITQKSSKSTQERQMNGKHAKSLSLPEMPLDVLFEMFSYLTPEDFLALFHTTKFFRNTLTNLKGVWRASRIGAGAPSPPPSMSETQWILFLYGNICEICDALLCDAEAVDFNILRRVCAKCMKKSSIARGKAQRRLKCVDGSLLDLVPYTNVVVKWNRAYPSSDIVYLNDDVTWMIDQATVLYNDVKTGKINAQKALDDFKKSQKDRLHDIQTNKDVRSSWLQDSRRTRFLEQVKSRFRQLGYVNSDLVFLNNQLQSKFETILYRRVSTTVWSQIRSAFEPAAMENKEERLMRRKRDFQGARRYQLHVAYKNYKKKVAPREWRYLPRTLTLSRLEEFDRYISSDLGNRMVPATFDEAFRGLAQLLEVQRRKLKEELIASIPMIQLGLPPGVPSEFPVDRLELATSVFLCTTCHSVNLSYGPEDHTAPPLIGWDAILSHHCGYDDEGVRPPVLPRNHIYGQYNFTNYSEPEDEPQVVYNVDMAKFSSKIVELAGLDPLTATVSDMNVRDLRFGCRTCKTGSRKDRHMRYGFAWKALIFHAWNERHDDEHFLTGAYVLPDADATKVKTAEATDAARYAKGHWTCSHCTVYFEKKPKPEEVSQHLNTIHGISSPNQPDDLFFFERIFRDPLWTVYEHGSPA